jgi:hypothetical protein
MTKKKKPDNVVFSEQDGYNAKLLPYSTNVGAPAIKMNDIVSWKSRGITNVNKEFEQKFNELKGEYVKLMEEYQWNELIYGAKFSFEPIIGESYHLYKSDDGSYFLSLISPEQWNKEFIGTFQLNSNKKWVMIEQSKDVVFES